MKLVSNTSPIVNLAAIGQLDLLRHLYEHVLIPDAVYRKITSYPEQPGQDVALIAWIERKKCQRQDLVQRLVEVVTVR